MINLILCLDIFDSPIFRLIEIVAPYIVLFVTIHNENRKFNEKNQLDNNNFQKNYSLQQESFNTQIYEAKESTRLSIMPYLVLLKNDITFSIRKYSEEFVDIELIFINKGNGVATNVMCEYIDNDNGKFTNIVSKTDTYDYYIAIPFDWYGNSAMINERLKMQIMFEPKRIKFDTMDNITSDQFNLEICYDDIQGRHYIQEFFIQFHLDNKEYKPLLIESYSPEVCGD